MNIRTRRFLERLALWSSVVALSLVVGAVGWDLIHAAAWDPLGHYPIQTVEHIDTVLWSTGSSSDTPIEVAAVPLGPIRVAGTKCANEEVTVHGTVFWQPVDPGGVGFPGGEGASLRQEGCQTFIYVNTPPPEVVAWAEGIIDSGGTPIMRLTGTETPTRDGTEGEPRTWVTEPFAWTEG